MSLMIATLCVWKFSTSISSGNSSTIISFKKIFYLDYLSCILILQVTCFQFLELVSKTSKFPPPPPGWAYASTIDFGETHSLFSANHYIHHNIIHIHSNVLWDWQYECEEYYAKHCRSHKTLLWMWIMLWLDLIEIFVGNIPWLHGFRGNEENCNWYKNWLRGLFLKLPTIKGCLPMWYHVSSCCIHFAMPCVQDDNRAEHFVTSCSLFFI